MASIYPSFEVIKRLKVQPTVGEEKLLKLLYNSLDDRFDIYFQPYLGGDRPDVILLNKEAGILIFEVKDWDLNSYTIIEGGQCALRKDRQKIKSLIQQINRYRTNMIQLHIEGLLEFIIKDKKYYTLVNSCLVFANSTDAEIYDFIERVKESQSGKRDISLDYLQYLGKDSLNDDDSLRTILENTRLDKKSYLLKPEFVTSIKRVLKPPIHDLEDGLDIKYTSAQQTLIDSNQNTKQKIKGVAGSGKTMVLAKRAVNAHIRTRTRVLVLTYNLSLKNYIHDRISDVREKFEWNNFRINNYHSFFTAESNNYNIHIESLADWQNVEHFKSVENINKYDTILIDEVQDFREEWLRIIINYFLDENGELVVFGDEKQNIYLREMGDDKKPIIPKVPGAWNQSLNQVYRFSGDLLQLMIAFQEDILALKYDIDQVEALQEEIPFDQTVIEYHQVDHINPKLVSNVIRETIEKNSLASSDICVLSTKVETLRDIDYQFRKDIGEKTTTTFETEEMVQFLLNQNNRNNENIENIDGESNITESRISGIRNNIKSIRRHKKFHFHMKTGFVKMSTIHSFKGWDIPTLFLIIDDETELEKAELIYTGITRARYRLYIINPINNPYHPCFFKNIKVKHKHYFVDEKINEIKDDFYLESFKKYKVGDQFDLISIHDGNKKKYKISKLKKYDVVIENGYKIKIIIRECGDSNASYRLRPGTKFLNEFFDKKNKHWVSYYREVTGIFPTKMIDEKTMLTLLNINGILLHDENNEHFSCGSTEDKIQVPKGSKLVSINEHRIKGKSQAQIINILNIIRGKPATLSFIKNDERIVYEIRALDYEKYCIVLATNNKHKNKPVYYFINKNKKIAIEPVIYLQSIDNQENLKFTIDRLDQKIKKVSN